MPAVASRATMVVGPAVMVGMIRNGRLRLHHREARQNQQGEENPEHFKATSPGRRGLAARTHTLLLKDAPAGFRFQESLSETPVTVPTGPFSSSIHICKRPRASPF